MGAERRMEADTYISTGWGIRGSLENRPDYLTTFGDIAKVTQPARTKGIPVSPEFGTPFLIANQMFDVRPRVRKWLAVDKIEHARSMFASEGDIITRRSANVGRTTLVCKHHEGHLISDHFFRVCPSRADWYGWTYAYLKAAPVRAMMTATQYGHIIKHLEIGHMEAMPIPCLRKELRDAFSDKVRAIVELRSRGHALAVQAESLFEASVGSLTTVEAEPGTFAIDARSMFDGRRRLEAAYHHPSVHAIYDHFAFKGLHVVSLEDAGFSVWLPTRFKRVPADDGVELLGSAALFEVTPETGRRIADGGFGDREKGRVRAGWLLVARSGQAYGLNGSCTIASPFHEGKVISDDVIRVAPKEGVEGARSGYVHVCLSHPVFGMPLVKALIYGSSIPHLDVTDLAKIGIVRLSSDEEGAIADLAERATACVEQADSLECEIADDASALIERFMAGDISDFTTRAEIVMDANGSEVAEDEADLKTARARLAAIKANPKRVVSGAALKARLAKMRA